MITRNSLPICNLNLSDLRPPIPKERTLGQKADSEQGTPLLSPPPYPPLPILFLEDLSNFS